MGKRARAKASLDGSRTWARRQTFHLAEDPPDLGAQIVCRMGHGRRGSPLSSPRRCAAGTLSNQQGLRIRAAIDTRKYEIGKKVGKEELKSLAREGPAASGPVRVAPVEDKGTLIVLTPQRFTVDNTAHVALALEVQRILGEAGMLGLIQ